LNRNKLLAIAHRNHTFSNPISELKMMKMIEKVPLKSQDKVIDIGSGKCELLIRLVENYNVAATGN